MASRSLSKRQNVAGESRIDPISNLPEDIVSHIFSFLPAKSAVATSFLSKTWNLRWTKLMTALSFKDSEWPNKTDNEMNFCEFVNMVLLMHNAESIHKFSLTCYNYHTLQFRSVFLSTWINAVIARNIRVIDLALSYIADSSLPVALYSCKTLETLKLTGGFHVRSPYGACLPKLTLLELHRVRYESVESFQKLISACPRLHSLFFRTKRYCDDERDLSYTISSSTLKRLDIDFGLCKVKLKISTPALEYFRYSEGNYNSKLSMVGPNSVNEAHFDDKHRHVELIQNFDHLKILQLAAQSMAGFRLDRAPEKFLATLKRLTKLSVHVDGTTWSSVLDLIGFCNNLEVFEHTNLEYDEFTIKACWTDPEHVPECFSSSLRRVSIKGFQGVQNEMEMLNFILQHGLHIETVIVSYNDDDMLFPISYDRKIQIKNKVLQLPRASPACKILFLNV